MAAGRPRPHAYRLTRFTEAARTAVMTQGHSLPRYRVNNVVANMPEFAHAFGCHAGQPMVHATQCRVW